MSDKVRCNCRRCTIRGLMGPAIIITVGVLFLLNSMRSGEYEFRYTWPVILIVAGLLSLASSLAPMDGHIVAEAPASAAPAVPPVAAQGTQAITPVSNTEDPFSGQGR